MIPEQNLPEVLEIPDGRTSLVRDTCVRVGYSTHGTIYHSQDGTRFYRLLSYQQMPIRRRTEFQRWLAQKNTNNFVRPVSLYDVQDNPKTDGYYILRYDSPTKVRPFLELLRDNNVYTRLNSCIQAINTFSTIAETERHFLPVPTDIVLFDEHNIAFLGLPQWDTVDLATSRFINERSLYLAPEYIRGQGTHIQDVQAYIIGCLLWMSFYPARNLASIPHFLQHVANGSIFKSSCFENNVPFWFRNIDAYQALLNLVQALHHPNVDIRRESLAGGDFKPLVQKLNLYWNELQPVEAVQVLRRKGEPDAALALLREIISTHQSTELLYLGSEIAKDDLKQPLEAIEFLESIIALEPNNEKAYYAQFRIFIDHQGDIVLTKLFSLLSRDAQQQINFAPIMRQFEEKVERNYQKFSIAKQKEEVESFASYFMHIGQYDKAARAVYANLFNNGEFLFWEFRLNLLYLEILIFQKRFDAADNQLGIIRDGLMRVSENLSVPMNEIYDHGQRLSELEYMLLQARKGK